MEPQRCPACRKVQFASRTQAQRAAKHLKNSESNEKRAFCVIRCSCRSHPWAVATREKHADHARRARMEIEQRIIEQEERESVIASIADDARFYALSSEFHLPWLQRTYGDRLAQEIIESAHQSLKELKK